MINYTFYLLLLASELMNIVRWNKNSLRVYREKSLSNYFKRSLQEAIRFFFIFRSNNHISWGNKKESSGLWRWKCRKKYWTKSVTFWNNDALRKRIHLESQKSAQIGIHHRDSVIHVCPVQSWLIKQWRKINRWSRIADHNFQSVVL